MSLSFVLNVRLQESKDPEGLRIFYYMVQVREPPGRRVSRVQAR